MRIAFVLLAAVLVGSLAPLAGEDRSANRSLRVLTYNIHHGEGTDGKVDLARIAKVIAAADPDLVALQEVDNKTKRTGGVDQTAELAKLTKTHGKFGKAIDFEGGGYGQAILSKYPLGDLTVQTLPGEPRSEQRVAAAAEVTLGGDSRKVLFVTTHLHHQSDELRQKQAAKLDELFAKSKRPVIAAGDLNARPDSKPLAVLAKNWTPATTGQPLLTFPAAKPTRQIDYVLHRPADKFKVIEAKVVEEAVASDHRPLLVVLEWPE